MIMEPLRGGKLVSMLPDKAKQAMKDSGREWTPAEWAFRWLYDQKDVTVVLSGMNSLEMVEENCRIASVAETGEMTGADRAVIDKVKTAIREKEKVGCTGCRANVKSTALRISPSEKSLKRRTRRSVRFRIKWV